MSQATVKMHKVNSSSKGIAVLLGKQASYPSKYGNHKRMGLGPSLFASPVVKIVD
jgi:hypothetical protein